MLERIETYECGNCGAAFAAGGGYSENGAFICKGCYDQRTAEAVAQASAARAQAHQRSIPSYGNIVKGASLLKGQANWLTIIGWVFIGMGIFLAIGAIVEGMAHDVPAAYGGAVAVLVSCIAIAIGFFNWATMIRMLAELALAQRDIARNSFGR